MSSGGKSVKVGYRYFFGIHMLVSRGEVDELVEIKVAARAAGQGAGNQRLFEFSMRLGLKRPQDAAAQAPGMGASAPAAAAKG